MPPVETYQGTCIYFSLLNRFQCYDNSFTATPKSKHQTPPLNLQCLLSQKEPVCLWQRQITTKTWTIFIKYHFHFVVPQVCLRVCACVYNSHWHTALTVKSTKYFWLNSPTQLLIHGQWWSIRRTQCSHVLEAVSNNSFVNNYTKAWENIQSVWYTITLE